MAHGFVLTAVRENFPQVRVAGSEVFREGLAFAANRMPSTELLQMDARKMPFVAEFDVIGAFDVLEHIEEDQGVLQQMRAAVKPGGGIIVTVPQHPWLWSGMDDYSFHKRRYTRAELTNKVKRAGFSPVWTTSFVTLLLPALMISRNRLKRYTDNFDPEVEYPIQQHDKWNFGLGIDFGAASHPGGYFLTTWRLPVVDCYA